MARNALLEASRRNAEAITAMGMVGRIAQRWGDLNRSYVAATRPSQRRRRRSRRHVESVAAVAAIGDSGGRRLAGDPSGIHAGIIIAGSILGARALAPVDLAIANWRGFVGARQSWQRLSRLLGHLPPRTEPMPLQPPIKTLVVQNAAV